MSFSHWLYQVATAVLSAGQIGSPIRRSPRKQKNTTVILGELTGVDADRKVMFVNSPDRANVLLVFEFLILATGVTDS
jgi:NADH dehydrogenase